MDEDEKEVLETLASSDDESDSEELLACGE
jgi:hypothetical protein